MAHCIGHRYLTCRDLRVGATQHVTKTVEKEIRELISGVMQGYFE